MTRGDSHGRTPVVRRSGTAEAVVAEASPTIAVLPESGRPNWFRRRVVAPLLEQLRQGLSPERLALSIAVGGTLSILPIIGVTTALCVFAGVRLRLNHVGLQVANAVIGTLQIFCLPVFAKAGAWIFNMPPPVFDFALIRAEATAAPLAFLASYGKLGAAACFAWALFAPFSILLIRGIATPVLRRFASGNP